MSPKFGVTHHHIIKALGGNPLRSMDELASRLQDPSVGWGYADQSIFCPKLFGLNSLRQKIIKRPVLSTTEVMLSPIKGKIELEPIQLNREYRAEDIPETLPAPKSASAPLGMKWDIDALAALCAEKGLRALDGEEGPVYDAAVIGCALTLWHTGHCASLPEAATAARAAIKSGEAMKRLQAGL